MRGNLNITPKSKDFKTYSKRIKFASLEKPLQKTKTAYSKIEDAHNCEHSHNSHCHKKCARCFQEKTNRLTLFLLQDDRVIDKNNPLICETAHKAPLPLFPKCVNSKNIKPKPKTIQINNSPKELIERTNKEKQHHIININKELIKGLNFQMNTFTNNKLKNPCWFSCEDNCFPKHKHPISSLTEYNNFSLHIVNNKQMVLEKLKQLSPRLADKKIKNQKRIPYLFKRLQSAKLGIPLKNKNKDYPQNNEKQNSVSNYYSKQKINLEEVLIMHNSNIRKSVSEFRVKNFQMKRSLKLNNKSIENSYINKRINRDEWLSAVNGCLYL